MAIAIAFPPNKTKGCHAPHSTNSWFYKGIIKHLFVPEGGLLSCYFLGWHWGARVLIRMMVASQKSLLFFQAACIRSYMQMGIAIHLGFGKKNTGVAKSTAFSAGYTSSNGQFSIVLFVYRRDTTVAISLNQSSSLLLAPFIYDRALWSCKCIKFQHPRAKMKKTSMISREQKFGSSELHVFLMNTGRYPLYHSRCIKTLSLFKDLQGRELEFCSLVGWHFS